MTTSPISSAYSGNHTAITTSIQPRPEQQEIKRSGQSGEVAPTNPTQAPSVNTSGQVVGRLINVSA